MEEADRLDSLFLYDCAGVAATLSHGLIEKNHFSQSLQLDSHDPFNFEEVYETQHYVGNDITDLVACAVVNERYFSIIHHNFFWQALPMIKEALPEKKIVMHYHGSDVRSSTPLQRINMEKDYVDGIIVATPDLLHYNYGIDNIMYLPTPIDTEYFADCKPRTDKKFTILRSQHDKDKFYEKLKGLNIGDVSVLQREYEIRPYKEMREFYCRYGGYVQLIYDKVLNGWLNVLSKTSLECLACGLKVYMVDGSVIDELPEEHRLENVTNKLVEFYERL